MIEGTKRDSRGTLKDVILAFNKKYGANKSFEEEALFKEFVLYIKKKPDDDNLKTVDEILNGNKPPKSKRSKS